MHVAVTDHPTAAWTSQQLREAFPWDGAPRYLVRDRDHAFANWAITAKAIGIKEILTAPCSPWQNAYVERLIGSVRRECLDHVIVFLAIGLQRLMRVYCAYYEQSRTHLSLNKDAPIPRRIVGPRDGRVVAIPQVGGLLTGTNGRRPDPTPSSLRQPESPLENRRPLCAVVAGRQPCSADRALILPAVAVAVR